MTPGLAVACHGKGCGWVQLWLLLWHYAHWWAILIVPAAMIAFAFASVLLKELFTGGRGNDA